MKVTVITGSPHKRDASALLADEFIRGAQEAYQLGLSLKQKRG